LEEWLLSPEIVRYDVGGPAAAEFEIDPVDGFAPAGPAAALARVRDAAAPAIGAARELLELARELSPDGVEVKFGVKVTGTANWLVARAATEGNFEVTLTWHPAAAPRPAPGA
jgi:hypothetical protein